MRKFSALIEDQVIALYSGGRDPRLVADDLEMDTASVYNILKRRDIPLRRGNRKANLRAFQVGPDGYTTEQKYWAGFLLGDGCICVPKTGNPMLILGLQDQDRSHVEKFAEFLKATHALRWNKSSGQWLMQVRGAHWIEDLAPLGVFPQKTTKERIPDEFLLDRDYWRGLIDADGSVRWLSDKGRCCDVNLSGSLFACDSFIEMVRQIAPESKPMVEKMGQRNCHRAYVNGLQAAIVINWLYSGSNIHLDRKFVKAMEIASHYGLT